jgi:hypothetical protein
MSTMTERFALIDHETGHVRWVGDAATPEAACQRATAETGGRPGTAYEHCTLLPTGTGYLVYRAPPGFDVGDGQDAVQIAAVRALPFLGRFAAVVNDDADA